MSSGPAFPLRRAKYCRFCMPVSSGYSPTFSSTMPMLGRTEKSLCSSLPSQNTEPEVRVIRPERARNSMVFPEPLRPTKP